MNPLPRPSSVGSALFRCVPLRPRAASCEWVHAESFMGARIARTRSIFERRRRSSERVASEEGVDMALA